MILPNDHVDVILTRHLHSGSGAQEQYVSDTLFHNIRILAIGQQIETKENGKKAAEGAANTATLELTPRQAERLALANSMGCRCAASPTAIPRLRRLKRTPSTPSAQARCVCSNTASLLVPTA